MLPSHFCGHYPINGENISQRGWEEEGPTRMKVARSLEKLGYIRCMLARDALRSLEAEACIGAKTKVRFVSINQSYELSSLPNGYLPRYNINMNYSLPSSALMKLELAPLSQN